MSSTGCTDDCTNIYIHLYLFLFLIFFPSISNNRDENKILWIVKEIAAVIYLTTRGLKCNLPPQREAACYSSKCFHSGIKRKKKTDSATWCNHVAKRFFPRAEWRNQACMCLHIHSVRCADGTLGSSAAPRQHRELI